MTVFALNNRSDRLSAAAEGRREGGREYGDTGSRPPAAAHQLTASLCP